ncbi:MAG TPA: F0F1 ATP synthase subunit B' [Xanthobacteraceae bacterium]|jgi:F-type H+-transporting ATPase subunit b|nr:F0F1 ATP synthase subunit B' [Xanthobacteraceae bacterium]
MAETTAHTEAPAGHTKFPPFESEHFPSQLVWLVISFVLLYALMSRIALPRIAGIMAARSKVIGDDLAAAEQLKERSNAAQAAYEKALADARGRAQAIAGATREQQARETEDLHKRLEAQLHDRIAAAEQSIAKSRGAAMGNVRSIAAETASAIVERLIGQRPRDEDIAAALGETGTH